jgi:hypothetical protein
MIVSYSRKFIFIKTRKTAGSTVEAVLETACAPGDIVSKYPDGVMPETGPRPIDSIADRYEGGTVPRPPKGRKNRGEFYNHMTAAEARPKIDATFWNSALKITVERHPYEKAVSQAFYRMFKHNNRNEAPDIYFDRVIQAGRYASFEMWSIDGKPAVDEIMRQENLQADMDRIGKMLGFTVPSPLPVMKRKTRPDLRPAREILSAKQREIVYEHCREEFELLGYER